MGIVPIHEREGLPEFIEFPWIVYGNDRSWIPPIREQIFHELSDASAFSSYGRSQLFLCEAHGQIVGRIAALVNPKLVDGHGAVYGQLGYFECIDDSDAAAALVGAGIDWLRTQGAREVLAPMNGGAHRSHRLLTRGFDREPFLFEPRNPPYYPRLFAGCGFEPIHRWFSYELNRQRADGLLKQFERVLGRRPAPGTIVDVAPHPATEVTSRIHELLDRCWHGHVGYASLDLQEFGEVFRGGLSIMAPGNIGVFVQNGHDAGFSLTYPDYAADVRALEGHVAEWGRWLGSSRPRRIVLHTAALVPDVRSSSAAMAQVAWCLRHGVDGGFEELIVALAVEGFVGKIGQQTREYALYSRSIV